MTNKEIPYTLNQIEQRINFMNTCKKQYERALSNGNLLPAQKERTRDYLANVNSNIKSYEEWRDELKSKQ